jgi:very-short-patch-repair endonuclease
MRDAKLTGHARENRKHMSEPETRMWLALRAERFAGVKFRRQKVIGPCITDFAANDPKLVIEIDGNTHDADDQRDANRTRFLEAQGYRVVRYRNTDVMQNLEGVLTHLTRVITEMQPPLPTLSPEGERA